MDIRDSIDDVVLYLGSLGFDAYLNDRKTQAAVERGLQIITEAAFRLGDEPEKVCPRPDWRNIRGRGNALRHAYDDVDQAILWATVKHDLPPLRAAVEAALLRMT